MHAAAGISHRLSFLPVLRDVLDPSQDQDEGPGEGV